MVCREVNECLRRIRDKMLQASEVGDRHRYLAKSRPEWSKSMWSVRNEGGPWECSNGHASLLVYRCSVCGKEL